MTTAEAAERAGVTTRQLLNWESAGRLAPADNGKTGNGRRLNWSEADVALAIEIRQQGENRSAAEETLMRLGGKTIIAGCARARSLRDGVGEKEAVVAGPRGVRIIQKLSLIAKAIEAVGTPAVLFERDTLL